jgi:hypothetical protein
VLVQVQSVVLVAVLTLELNDDALSPTGALTGRVLLDEIRQRIRTQHVEVVYSTRLIFLSLDDPDLLEVHVILSAVRARNLVVT